MKEGLTNLGGNSAVDLSDHEKRIQALELQQIRSDNKMTSLSQEKVLPRSESSYKVTKI